MVVQAKLWGESVGELFYDQKRKQVFFKYKDTFLNKGLEISPILMPTNSKIDIFSFPFLPVETFKGLPPVFSDSLPDAFGSMVLNTYLQTSGKTIHDLNPLERLSYVGTRGMGALEYFPVYGENIFNEKKIVISDIVHVAKDVMLQKESQKNNSLNDILLIGTSAGGARPKAIIAIDNKTKEVFSGEILNKNKNFTYYLLKIDGASNNENATTSQYGKIEYAYYQLAFLSGINMTKTELFHENGRNHFLTERYDRINGEKIHTQSLNSIANLNYNDPLAHSYEQCFNVMRKINCSKIDMEQQFRRLAFNVIAKNLDDHTKNITFLMDKSGFWKLSPAYDMTFAFDPSNRWLKQHQMSVVGKRNNIDYNDLISFAKAQFIHNPNAIIQDVCEGVSQWMKIASNLDIAQEKTLWIEKNIQYNSFKPLKIYSNFSSDISSEEKIKIATDFHLNNNYSGKINNIVFDGVDGALNKALLKNFSFRLSSEQLKICASFISSENKVINKKPKL